MPHYYWLDANVFIEAKNNAYAFDIAPGFWEAIESLAKSNRIRCPDRVRTELLSIKDELSAWVGTVEPSGLFAGADQAVQRQVGNIAQFVQNNYETAQSKYFLDAADPWIIAHADLDKGVVVTLEQLAPSNSKRVKIPNICKHFNVPYMNTYFMLRKLGVSLGRKS